MRVSKPALAKARFGITNRSIRSALMRIADTASARGMDVRKSRVKTAKKFSRVTYRCVGGVEPMKYPAFQQPNSIIEKLREFHHVHQTPLDETLKDLEIAGEQFPYNTRGYEATVVSEVLRQNSKRKRGTPSIGALLPAVLARLGVNETDSDTTENTTIRDRS